MAIADRSHLEDLPLDQLHAFAIPQNSRLGHAVVFVDVEEASRR